MATPQSARSMQAPVAADDGASLLDARITIPHHVVYRSFPSETVVLNLDTGKYHGLNPTAGTMLATFERASCVREALDLLVQQYERPRAEVEQDVRALCGALLERGLIELDDPSPS